jgi:hypothetical protein
MNDRREESQKREELRKEKEPRKRAESRKIKDEINPDAVRTVKRL